ncbi:drug/metabolite transporter (DMT)-like permease [Melghirimyces profundicolus]|uniref:Drug/metabolite transporter (DMT)-like permease n=1 Tax=Melghirimyces profundicolus TaxID=1242148 RepID=A0A2T6C4R5_9BACL|nr:DMT family transporter [Melghirimyces profundicolus]PTX63282.1 drug/metabolite transporter (DMT)-like permease [Melghirimyces profundicolus]
MGSRRQAWILLTGITVIWGYTWIPMKTGLNHLGPFSFSFYRFLIGSVVLLSIAYFSGRLRLERGEVGWLVLLGLLQTTATFGFWMAGMERLPAGTSSILAYTMPLWTYLLAVFFLSERPNSGKLAGLLLGLAGLVGVAGPEAVGGMSAWKAMGLVLVGSICWAGSNILVRARFSGKDKISLTAFQMTVGTVGLAALTLWFEPGFSPDRWSLDLVANLLFTGLFSSAFAFVAWFFAVSALGAGEAAVSVLLVPVLALVFGWLQLGEEIGWIQAAGTVLVLTGVGLVQKKGQALPEERKDTAEKAADGR